MLANGDAASGTEVQSPNSVRFVVGGRDVNAWLSEITAAVAFLRSKLDKLDKLPGQMMREEDVHKIVNECIDISLKRYLSALTSMDVLTRVEALETTQKTQRLQLQALEASTQDAARRGVAEEMAFRQEKIQIAEIGKNCTEQEEQLCSVEAALRTQRFETEAFEVRMHDAIKNSISREASLREERLETVETRMCSNLNSVVVAEMARNNTLHEDRFHALARSSIAGALEAETVRHTEYIHELEAKWAQGLQRVETTAATRFDVATAAEAERQDRALEALRCNTEVNELLGALLEEQTAHCAQQAAESWAHSQELQAQDVLRRQWMEEYCRPYLDHMEATERRIAGVSSELHSVMASRASQEREKSQQNARSLEHMEATERRIAGVSSELRSLVASTASKEHESPRIGRVQESMRLLKEDTVTQLERAKSSWHSELLAETESAKRCIVTEAEEAACALQELRSNVFSRTREMEEIWEAQLQKEARAHAESLRPLQASIEELQLDLKSHTHELHFDMAHAQCRGTKPVPAGAGSSAVRSLSMATAATLAPMQAVGKETRVFN